MQTYNQNKRVQRKKKNLNSTAFEMKSHTKIWMDCEPAAEITGTPETQIEWNANGESERERK